MKKVKKDRIIASSVNAKIQTYQDQSEVII